MRSETNHHSSQHEGKASHAAAPPAGTPFCAGGYGSAGSMGAMAFLTFDGLPDELRRSVSGRMFLEARPQADTAPPPPPPAPLPRAPALAPPTASWHAALLT